jgi:hypothetical protein
MDDPISDEIADLCAVDGVAGLDPCIQQRLEILVPIKAVHELHILTRAFVVPV